MMRYTAIALMTAAFSVAASHVALAEEPGVPGDTKTLAELLGSRSKPAEANLPTELAKPPMVGPTSLAPLTTMVGLAVGLGALFVGGAFVLKRFKSRGMFDGASKELQLEESLWVGRGQRLLLVSVGARRVLLGVTGSGFESLAVLEENAVPMLPGTAAPAAVPMTNPSTAPSVRPDRPFADVMKDELVTAFKPSPSDRRKILQRLNTL